jgi:hypothetical protein
MARSTSARLGIPTVLGSWLVPWGPGHTWAVPFGQAVEPAVGLSNKRPVLRELDAVGAVMIHPNYILYFIEVCWRN